MSESLLIGARGWEHEAWLDNFYPAALPEDWRFSYYCKMLRAVLVPQALWANASRETVAQLVEDSDPAFRFVLELPRALSQPLDTLQAEQAANSFLENAEPVLTRTAGLLLRIAPDTDVDLDWLEHLLNRLSRVAPLCVDLPENEWRDEAALAVLARQGAGLAWHAAHEPAVQAGGRLMVALVPAASPRELRGWIEKLAHWQTPGAQAALIFDAPATAAKAAQEARIIADLMGV
jgi:uncharacterized protein YecE (DUF72 family)